ncbi:MAG: hypothetical protein D6816_02390 [Bacteroidetes bacterium]|nr:MAG: hypothetical protein D6816_02390 [Bacteroidota bacterium]
MNFTQTTVHLRHEQALKHFHALGFVEPLGENSAKIINMAVHQADKRPRAANTMSRWAMWDLSRIVPGIHVVTKEICMIDARSIVKHFDMHKCL